MKLSRARRLLGVRQGGKYGVPVEHFLFKKFIETEVGSLQRNRLPDGVTVRRVADINALPQGRCNFSDGVGARAPFTTLPIDYRKARRGK